MQTHHMNAPEDYTLTLAYKHGQNIGVLVLHYPINFPYPFPPGQGP